MQNMTAMAASHAMNILMIPVEIMTAVSAPKDLSSLKKIIINPLNICTMIT